MAAICASIIVCPAAVAKVQPSKAGLARMAAPSAATFSAKTVSNGMTTKQMLVWTPINNKCALLIAVAGNPTAHLSIHIFQRSAKLIASLACSRLSIDQFGPPDSLITYPSVAAPDFTLARRLADYLNN